MRLHIELKELVDAGLAEADAQALLSRIEAVPDLNAPAMWTEITRSILTPDIPFDVHSLLFRSLFSEWDAARVPPPAWSPSEDDKANANITTFAAKAGVDPRALHAWSVNEREAFWKATIDTLGIRFHTPPTETLEPSLRPDAAVWLPGAKMNIAESCFQAPGDKTAIVYRKADRLERVTYDELDRLSNRIANSFAKIGIGEGDAIAIDMPMTVEAVAAYLGIVKMGGVVVSIADSFAEDEIATRLRIANASIVLTQDLVVRGPKRLPMYEKVTGAGAGTVIVIPGGDEPAVKSPDADADADAEPMAVTLRKGDHAWHDFLVEDDAFTPVPCNPEQTTNVLFSSGTTGDPKAIPWTHTTPIKCAMDGYLHHDIHPGEVVAWPTNLGWMMGPWLIYATLVNRGTMALFYGAPGGHDFCRFVQDAGVQMLGVVPSLVKAWRGNDTVHRLDWSCIRVFSSTGEASNADDYLYLMSLAGYRPIIEYCGGTEIGGGYISGTVDCPASPATFSTPCFGLDLYLLDESGKPADQGEVFLVPPSIGLSNRILNKEHHAVYYKDTPAGPNGEMLRRHGDQMERIGAGYFRALGRADDTMNLGGIKVSSTEIENVLNGVEGVMETAAIATDPPGGGPSRLVIFAVLAPDVELERRALRRAMQRAIKERLNPLFRVHDVVTVNSLPRTASNKVMRRVLRADYVNGGKKT